jgi:hypothetical protein
MTSQDDRKGVHKRPRMAVPSDAPAGIEQDDKGNLIPFEQRTKDNQEKARDGG